MYGVWGIQKAVLACCGQGEGTNGPRVGWLASAVSPPLAGLEASTGFLVGRVGACPLVVGAGSWPFAG